MDEGKEEDVVVRQVKIRTDLTRTNLPVCKLIHTEGYS